MNALELVNFALEKHASMAKAAIEAPEVFDKSRCLTNEHEKLLNVVSAQVTLPKREQALALTIAGALRYGSYRNPLYLNHLQGKLFKACDNFVYYEGVTCEHYTFRGDLEAELAGAKHLEAKLEQHLNAGLLVGFGTCSAPADVEAAKHPQFLRSLYTVFRKDDKVIAICHLYDEDGAIAIEKDDDGAIATKRYAGAYEAFHALSSQGFLSVTTSATPYHARNELFDLLGVPDDEFGRLTGFEFAKV